MTTQATHTPPRRTSASDLAHDPHEHVRLDFTVAERDDRLAEIEREKVLRDPGFGKTFTDHMVKAVWTLGEGWHDAEVTAYGPLLIDPATAVLHYAQEIFEGMKA
jgi:branched-chain amino acid aminotransferase